MHKKILNTLNDNHRFLANYIKDNLPSVFYRRAFNKKISHMDYMKDYQLPETYKQKINDFWAPYQKIKLMWHEAYTAASGRYDVRYIPESVFYRKIEPKLNRYDLVRAYADKNRLNQLFPDIPQPKTIIRNMNGNYFNADYYAMEANEAIVLIKEQARKKKLVLKPAIETGAGKNVRILDFRRYFAVAIEKKIRALFKEYGQDFIVQEYLDQHEVLSQLHEKSLNTIRIISLRLDNEIHILSSVLRMGNHGTLIDNSEQGCVTIGMKKDGDLHPFAMDHWTYEKYEAHPYSQFPFSEVVVPNMSQSYELVKKAHKKILYFDIVSWDIGIDQNGKPHLIEMNMQDQDINYHQKVNGPLFGQWTEEILKNVYFKA